MKEILSLVVTPVQRKTNVPIASKMHLESDEGFDRRIKPKGNYKSKKAQVGGQKSRAAHLCEPCIQYKMEETFRK